MKIQQNKMQQMQKPNKLTCMHIYNSIGKGNDQPQLYKRRHDIDENREKIHVNLKRERERETKIEGWVPPYRVLASSFVEGIGSCKREREGDVWVILELSEGKWGWEKSVMALSPHVTREHCRLQMWIRQSERERTSKLAHFNCLLNALISQFFLVLCFLSLILLRFC